MNPKDEIRILLVDQEVKWCAQGDDFRTFLGEFVSSLPQVEVIVGLSL
jgi:hypothetical protein